MGSFLDEIFSDPKRAFKKRMSTSSSFSLPSRKKSSALHISSPVLTHASGIYSNTSPDRSTFLVDLQASEYTPRSPSAPPTEDTHFLSREPRKSCPDIRIGNSLKSRDHKYRAQKREEFESMIEDSKVLRISLTPDYAST
ncbi:unnamed protein product [Umbelopsis ramanniana]